MKTWGLIIAAFVVVTAGVGFGAYKFGVANTFSGNQKLLNHCLDVADQTKTTDIQDLNALGISDASARQKADDDHKAAVAECQVRYPAT